MTYGENDAPTLEPPEEIPAEDAWAYTPEHLRRLEQADADARAGRVVRLTERELEQWIADHTDDGIADYSEESAP